jgi:hypothetical protein
MKREPHAFKLMPEEPNPADDNLPSHISWELQDSDQSQYIIEIPKTANKFARKNLL